MSRQKPEASDFIKEQYIHLNEHRRQVNGFSGQILAIIFAGFVLSLGLKSDSLEDWSRHPLLPAASFLAISLLFVVMWASHSRNVVSRGWLDSLIAALEEKYGERPTDWGLPNTPRGRAWLGENIPSSKLVSVFLALMAVVTFCISIYYWVKLANS